MSAPFTPEQEARIAEIVRTMLLDIDRRRFEVAHDDLDCAIDWAVEKVKRGG